MSADTLTGGCQCGAIRYRISGPLHGPGICHCRMCQKAFGSFFAPFVGVAMQDFQITRGEIAVFRSSDVAERGFCRNCGTPLSIHNIGDPTIEVAIGSMDEPEAVKPVKQVGIEGRLSWFAELVALPEKSTDDNEKTELLKRIAASNHQHPDHETSDWTAEPAGTGHSA